METGKYRGQNFYSQTRDLIVRLFQVFEMTTLDFDHFS